MSLRVVYPSVTKNGLGNNLITVAKAHLISESCRLTYQPPVWPANIHVWPPTGNGYGHFFPSTVGDRLRLQIFDYNLRFQNKLGRRLWPTTMAFTNANYLKHGVVDIGESCLQHLASIGLGDTERSLVVTTNGMWGGYTAIRRARGWLRDLLMSHDESRRRFEAIQKRSEGKMRIVVNIKLDNYAHHRGYFEEGERIYRIPLDWYLQICRQIKEIADCAIILVSDGSEEELSELIAEVNPIHFLGEPRSDLLGLLLMVQSDLVICSNSTYSRLACFLNDKPYVWIADTLVKDSSQRFGYLWKDTGTPMPSWFRPKMNSSSINRDAIRRCFALSYGFTEFPEGLGRYLSSNGKLPIEISDDLLYGDPVYLI